MNRDEAHALLAETLRRIAPEVDLAVADTSADLLDELDLDSMDFLTLVGALHERTGLDIPEADYPELDSIDAVVGYLSRRSG